MSDSPSTVRPCRRCGQPAELPAVAEGVLVGERTDDAPLCQACIGLLLDGKAEEFWAGMRGDGKGSAAEGGDDVD